METIKGLPKAAPSIKELGGEAWSMVGKTPERSFNASLGYSEKHGYVMVVRKSNYRLDLDTGVPHLLSSGERSVRNIVGLSKLDNELNPISWHKIEFPDGPIQERGVEDARIFWRKDRFYIHCVFLERSYTRARVALYKLSDDLKIASFIKIYDSEQNEKAIEKNWMTELSSNNEDIDFIRYNPNGIRGGSSLIPWGNGYLALVHKTYAVVAYQYSSKTFGEMKGATKHYRHLFAEYDKNYILKRVSKEFTFRPNGQIEFGMGLVEKDNHLYMSLGVNDEEVWMAKLSKSKVKQLLLDGDNEKI